MRHLRLLALLLLALPTFGAGPRKYIVEYRANALAPRIEEDAPRLRVKRQFTRAFRGAAIELAEGESIEEVARLPYVASVHVDGEVVAYETSSPFSPPQRGEGARRADEGPRLAHWTAPHPALRATLSPRSGARGESVIVAIIDTGIDRTHPALAGKVVGGWDFVNDDGDAMDDHRHGTHVAGIIAAESDRVTGVAPGVQLLAYKVLNHEGRGDTSDVIAAIERALDPNGDGNFDDRADVANLSLGNRGWPGDPLSRAVDNAVAHGMTVVVAAGNDGLAHSIGSPAGAANAITVGAWYFDDDHNVTVAEFSSRGPATQSGAIKPDLLAPGVRILSTVLDHGYGESSGTSMATPYVSGLAALLLEQHPDWTPARIKAALATSAVPIANEEVMVQGAGVANFERAAATSLTATPTQLSFGLDGGSSATWTSMRRITLRNDGTTPRTYNATITGTNAAIAIALTANEFTLAPGESRDVDATLTVDHATLGRPASRTFAFGGLVTFATNGEEVRLPWAFVRAGRATFAFADRRPDIAWNREGQHSASIIPLSEFALEALLEPGTYDFFVVGAKGGDVRLVVREQQLVAGDVAYTFTDADSPHAVRLEATDHRGAPFEENASTLQSKFVRLLLPRGNSLAVPSPSGKVIRSSSFSTRVGLLASQAFVDGNEIHIAQHEVIRGLDGDRTLTTTPGQYASQEVRLHFAPNATRREISIMPREWPRSPIDLGAIPPALRTDVNSSTWTGTLWMTPEVHENYSAGVQLGTYTDADLPFIPGMNTPVIRLRTSGFFAARGFDPPATAHGVVAGETMEFGAGPIVFEGALTATEQGLFGPAEVLGARGETRRAEKVASTYRVTATNGQEVATGTLGQGSFWVPLSRRGAFNIEVRVPRANGEAIYNARFDTSAGEATVPSFTSFAILDGTGRHTTALPHGGNGSLVFSSTARNAGVFFRRRGLQTWVQLTPVEIAHDPTYGYVFRVDLADALRIVAGEIELAVEVANEQGNRAQWHLAPAFSSSTPSSGKTRSVRK